jgi:hypothetical protein
LSHSSSLDLQFLSLYKETDLLLILSPCSVHFFNICKEKGMEGELAILIFQFLLLVLL